MSEWYTKNIEWHVKLICERDATIAELRFEVAGLKEAIEQAAIRNTQIAEEGAEFRSELGTADGTIRELREQLAAARVSLDQMRAYAVELKARVSNPEYAASIQRHIDQAEAK